MKKWFKDLFKNWWYRRVTYPGIMKHKVASTVALKDTIVYQMWYAGISFQQINKWLRINKLPTIKAYVMQGPNKDKIRLFYELPDQKRRAEIGGNIVLIA